MNSHSYLFQLLTPFNYMVSGAATVMVLLAGGEGASLCSLVCNIPVIKVVNLNETDVH